MTGRLLKKARMPRAMVQMMIGLSKAAVERMTLEALDRAGIDISDPKAIIWERLPDGGCAFAGPPKAPGG
tara:strand:+ start:20053 stop:20262 length:210 start_codon:yes stop_codon:yes gene_type:complete